MAGKQIKVSRRMLFTWFMLAGLIFLFSPQRFTNKFQFAFARIFSWPLTVGRTLSNSPHTEYVPDDVVSRSKYNKLQNHLANVTQWLDQERQKVQKLSAMRDRPVWKGVGLILADVITASIDSLHSELIIN